MYPNVISVYETGQNPQFSHFKVKPKSLYFTLFLSREKEKEALKLQNFRNSTLDMSQLSLHLSYCSIYTMYFQCLPLMKKNKVIPAVSGKILPHNTLMHCEGVSWMLEHIFAQNCGFCLAFYTSTTKRPPKCCWVGLNHRLLCVIIWITHCRHPSQNQPFKPHTNTGSIHLFVVVSVITSFKLLQHKKGEKSSSVFDYFSHLSTSQEIEKHVADWLKTASQEKREKGTCWSAAQPLST